MLFKIYARSSNVGGAIRGKQYIRLIDKERLALTYNTGHVLVELMNNEYIIHNWLTTFYRIPA